MLTRSGQRGEVIQQRDANRDRQQEASIDEAPYESNFQPRRKLLPFKRLPWPDDPAPLTAGDTVTLEGIDFTTSLAAFYRTA
jgi:hypothetical protein